MILILRPAAVLLVFFTVLTGGLYPLAVTGVAQVVFPGQANGSLVRGPGDRVVGSALIGQSFSGPGYFWSRPSATGPVGYNAASSSGSNLGPTNPALAEAVRTRVSAIQAANSSGSQTAVPVDLVTTSGSGLDPHITPAAAAYQLDRVARARGQSREAIAGLVEAATEGRTLGLLGEPRVNVLQLNLSLDELSRKASHRGQ